ncbi:MAG TPA: hypothetical protein VD815_04825 [Candidatus Saccharimonadales bacterium]|nr:hypothetical protein [Candidatus Saccharimonadales bacterium]
MTHKIEIDNQLYQTRTERNVEQSFKVESDYAHQDSNLETEQLEARQRVFNQSPEYKKREIVFGQIQRINSRLSDLEEKVDEILAILKADR